MTLDGVLRELIRTRLGKYAHSFRPPARAPQVVAIDLMQWVKVITEKMNIVTVGDMVKYLVRRCLAFMTADVQFLIICWDRGSPEVKKLICHSSRYAKKEVLSPNDAPHLPDDPQTRLADIGLDNENWLRFSASGVNLRRELGPRIVNAFMEAATLARLLPHQRIVLNGLPVKRKVVTVFDSDYAPQWGEFEKRHVPVPWTMDISGDGFGDLPLTERMEEDDPALYHRVFFIERRPGNAVHVEEHPEMENSVLEGDSAIFWIDHFFPNLDQLLVINDGDAILIGLLYARERMVNSQFRNIQTLCLKYCKKKPAPGEDWGIRTTPPDYEYVDLNALFCAAEEDPEFEAAGVNNHVLPYVFLSILPGNDFFDNYCKGIGTQIIVKTFFETLPMFANMLQWNNAGLLPSSRDYRRIIIDENAFVQFTYQVYLAKYGAAIRKHYKQPPSPELLRDHLEDAKYPLPPLSEIKRQCRQIQWVFDYLVNAPRGIHVDPAERHHGLPYYGYARNDSGELQLSSEPLSKRKKMDESYKKNLFKRKMQSPREISPGSKKRAIDAVKNLI